MCSIFGVDSKAIPLEKLRAGFDRTVSRGPDMSRFVEIPRGYLGFHRLAIMGLTPDGMQPFEMDGKAGLPSANLSPAKPGMATAQIED